ncbi:MULTISPECIES: flagellar hook assembly protein FlgD [Vibrio]|jgi:flagellar basal-body rod modification protein FlgD|uniref:Basal-body rod modification protein FlgD n=2 Tax=Vibrio alginolyticus TaxID=663 RepID=A0A0L8DBT0_VIBAL|nr:MULTISPECIES: flagellar hook assembly protein FlgD [Vibrio]EEZ84134.1 flagellar basal body rod modification protein [Vibrio alginolyticus 40B]MDW1807770.1 flagellar hook assembly protein FlgD [Vibrio sp. Vb2362]MDW1972568.1 flagellar hook assembly protein FlgD [Vibrio sp. 945]MDW2260096.1 flagellar hook assembly protein FlgD [Vibrio sp. 1409]MDW2295252.1 flagellar hook assembly protein FlgD [Vibrio sp. 1404]NAW54654.1 flagellar hook assembly protein FlgD [Vibrio sp. V41_P2S12T139]NAW93851
MAGINNVGQSGLSYIDQLKSLQESNKKAEESTGKQDLKQEDFLSLLTKQLSQQDPFKPVSNDQMIAQMASFATVDGIGKMNTQFESLNSSMTSNQALQASSLVGRDVLVPGAAGVKQDDAPMAAMVKLSQSIDNLFVRVEDEAGQLVRTFEVGAKPAGDTRVLWDGKDESGNPLPAGKYKVKASGLVEGESQEFPVSTYANVNSVLLGKGDGNVLLNLAGFESPVRLAEVLEVGKA